MANAKVVNAGFTPIDADTFGKSVLSMFSAGKRLHAMISALLLQALWQNMGSGTSGERFNGWEFAQKLYTTLPDGVRKDAVLAHLEKYGNLAYSKKEKRITYRDNGKSWDYDLLSALDWNASKPDPKPISKYDFDSIADAAIQGMLKKQKQALEESIECVHSDVVGVLLRALNEHRASTYKADSEVMLSENIGSLTVGFMKQQDRKESVMQ
jgi:hypothetical protein